MTNSNTRNGLAWGRYLKQSVAVVPHERASLLTPLYEAFKEPIVIDVDTYSGFATIYDESGEQSRCKVTHEMKGDDLIPVLVDDNLGIRVELDRFKVSLRCHTSEHLVPKRLEKVQRVPKEILEYNEISLDDLSGAEGYAKVSQKLGTLRRLKEEILSEMKENALTTDRQSYLAYTLDVVKTDIERCQDKEKEIKLSLIADFEYTQKFMDAALAALDPLVIQKIQDMIE